VGAQDICHRVLAGRKRGFKRKRGGVHSKSDNFFYGQNGKGGKITPYAKSPDVGKNKRSLFEDTNWGEMLAVSKKMGGFTT